MESLFSPSWYRVAGLKPRLRGHTHIHRHEYRGEIWYVLEDEAKGRYYRFTPVAHSILGLMDGEHTVQELWEQATGKFGDEGPTQNDMVQIMSQLHSADVLQCDVPPDTSELLRRAAQIRESRWKSALRSPLSLRIPILDPERFLARTVAAARPFFTIYGSIAWVAIVGAAAMLAARHWSELTRNLADRVLAADNLLLIWIIFPFVKALHELGHGYAVKTWGGEVHDMGIMLLVLVPVPYVDASVATRFQEKHRRVIVGAAGIAVELLIASLALFVWLNVQPGMLRSVAYNITLIGSVSTLFFNANPLLRYDGYYILSDLLEAPNLAQRGMAYLGYLAQTYLFRVRDARPPHVAPGERFWLLLYPLASFVYRAFVYTAIVLFIAGKFFGIGLLLAGWAVISMAVAPLSKGIYFLATSTTLHERRPRAWLVSAAGMAAVCVALFLVPFPCRTRAEGVLWVPEDSHVRAGNDGFIRRLAAQPGTHVEPGQLLLECEEPLLQAQVRVLQARLEEMKSRYDAALATDQVQAQIVREEIRDTRAELERGQERLGDLNLTASQGGELILPDAEDLPGLYLHKGDLVGYVLNIRRPTIRVVVPQSRADLVRRRTRAVAVRFVGKLDQPAAPATILREVPQAAEKLPSTVLGRSGGGEVAVDPFESSGTKSLERLFQFDIELGVPVSGVNVNGRAYVLFDHGYEPPAFQLYRSARQLLLRRLHV